MPLFAAPAPPALHANPHSGLPILFEANRGQSPAEVRFLARASGAQILLRQQGLTLRTRGAAEEQMNFVQPLESSSPAGQETAIARVNYLSRSFSVRDIPTFRQVRYAELYPGIDLRAYGLGGNFEFDLELKPGADLARFALDVSTVASLDGQGALRLGPAFTLRAPVAYQVDERGRRHAVQVRYVLRGRRVTLAAAAYDAQLGLVVDPQLVMTYATYLSGSNGSTIFGVATDPAGDVYVAGIETSTDFPTQNPLQTTGTLFISELNPAGTALIYSTYIAGTSALPGPSNSDGDPPAGHMLAVDSSGAAYLVGRIQASDTFPLTSSAYPLPAPSYGSQYLGFLAKLSVDGSQIAYATYTYNALYSNDPMSVAVDNSGNAYVVGGAGYNQVPTTGNAFLSSIASSNVESAYLEKFNTTLSGAASLPYSSYFGLNGVAGIDVACDSAGHGFLYGTTLVVSTGHGGTASGTIPTRNAIQATAPGNNDAVLAEFDTTASGDASLLAATYIGGTGNDFATAIALDSSNNVYLTGTTTSGDFLPNPNGTPAQSYLLSPQDGFVAKIAASGSALTLVYSTYIGNTATTTPTGIAAIADGEAVLTGTATAGLTTLSGLAVAAPTGTSADNFLADLSPTGQSYAYSSYLGNMVQTNGASASSFVALEGSEAVVAGTWANSANPLATTSGAVQTSAPASGSGGFIAKYVFQSGTAPYIATITPNTGSNVSAVSFTISGGSFESGATVALNASSGAVQAQLVTVSADGRTITGSFDLRGGVATGAFDVVVTNPDTTSATLTQGFTVQASNNDQIFTQVLGPSSQRIGGGMVYTVLYGNSGNTDEFGVPLFITFNNTFQYQVLSPLYTQNNANSGGHLDFTQGTLGYDDGNGNTVLMLFLPVIKAGTTAAVQLLLTAPASQSFILSSYQIQSELFPPVFQVGAIGTTVSATPRLPAGIEIAGLTPPAFFARDESHPLAGYMRDLIPTATGDRLFANLASVLHRAKTGEMEDFFGFWQGASSQPQWVQNLVYTVAGRRCISNVMQTTIDYLADGIGLVPGVGCVTSAAVGMFATQTKIVIGTSIDSTYQPPDQAYQDVSNALDAAGCIPVVGLSKSIFNGVKHTIFATFYALDCGSVAATGQGLLGRIFGRQGSLSGQFVGGFDPNLKSGPVGAGALQWIAPPQALNYSIEFQNDPTATAPAQSVLVVDAINSNVVDLTSIAFGPVIVGTHLYTPPPNTSTIDTTLDLRPDVNMLVQVQASVDTQGSDLVWQFTSIDPSTGLPLSSGSALGFLPADTPAPIGEGNLSFSARMLPGVTTGTSLSNGASVIFDTNPPIFTPIWANTIDADPPVSSITPLPASETVPVFPVSWSGTDNGSGIGSYTIFVSQNGGAYTPWLTSTALTSAMYPGTPGSSYAFFSEAQDAAGNSEALKTTADAGTAVPTVSAPVASLSAASLNFPATTVTTSSSPQSITLTNNGNAALAIGSVAIAGGDGASFSLGGSCGPSIPAGMACTLNVTFAPSAAGTLSTTLTFTDNASTSPQTVALNGIAADGSTPSATTLTASSASVPLHQPVTLTATVMPTSAGTPTGAVSFYAGSVLLGPATLNSNGTASLVLTTLPAGPNTLTAIYSGNAQYTASTSNAVAVNVSPQDIWVVNANGTVSVLDNAGAAALSPLTGGGAGLAIDNAGNVWTSNASSGNLVEFNSSGSQLGIFTGGGLSTPTSLAISGAGAVWVANGNGTLSTFTSSGTALSPAQGLDGGGLNAPSAIAIDSSGSVWVANSGNNSVTQFLGATDPVVTPLATAAATGTLGAKP
jgi:hypothetical protein